MVTHEYLVLRNLEPEKLGEAITSKEFEWELLTIVVRQNEFVAFMRRITGRQT